MATYVLAAGLLALVVGAVHSLLGELLIFRHLRSGALVPAVDKETPYQNSSGYVAPSQNIWMGACGSVAEACLSVQPFIAAVAGSEGICCGISRRRVARTHRHERPASWMGWPLRCRGAYVACCICRLLKKS